MITANHINHRRFRNAFRAFILPPLGASCPRNMFDATTPSGDGAAACRLHLFIYCLIYFSLSFPPQSGLPEPPEPSRLTGSSWKEGEGGTEGGGRAS